MKYVLILYKCKKYLHTLVIICVYICPKCSSSCLKVIKIINMCSKDLIGYMKFCQSRLSHNLGSPTPNVCRSRLYQKIIILSKLDFDHLTVPRFVYDHHKSIFNGLKSGDTILSIPYIYNFSLLKHDDKNILHIQYDANIK